MCHKLLLVINVGNLYDIFIAGTEDYEGYIIYAEEGVMISTTDEIAEFFMAATGLPKLLYPQLQISVGTGPQCYSI